MAKETRSLREQIRIAIDLLPSYKELLETDEPDNLACDIAEAKRYLEILAAVISQDSNNQGDDNG